MSVNDKKVNFSESAVGFLERFLNNTVTVFSESEVPILTTQQAPTVLKGVYLVIYYRFNSIWQ